MSSPPPGSGPRSSIARWLFAGALAATLLLAAVAASAKGAEDYAAELERWVFSGALEVAGFGHRASGEVSATDITGPRVASPRPWLGDDGLAVVRPRDSSAQVSSALVGGTFEVMTPEVFPALAHARFFADVNLSAVFTNDVGFARDADPGEMSFPGLSIAQQLFGEMTIVGRGTKMTVQHQGPQLHAGIGPAFTIDIGSERIRIKPSLVYSRMIVDLFVVGHRAVRLNDDTGPRRDFEDDFRAIQLSQKVREVYHGAGPALEIEYETGERVGPFGVTVFAKGHVSHLFGSLTTRLEQVNPDPDAPGEIIRWRYSPERWVVRVSAGIRFRWVPR